MNDFGNRVERRKEGSKQLVPYSITTLLALMSLVMINSIAVIVNLNLVMGGNPRLNSFVFPVPSPLCESADTLVL